MTGMVQNIIVIALEYFFVHNDFETGRQTRRFLHILLSSLAKCFVGVKSSKYKAKIHVSRMIWLDGFD